MSDNPLKEVMQRDLDELIEKNECYAACRAINPDNPAGAAEALPELVEALEWCRENYANQNIGHESFRTSAMIRADKALSKLKARP